MSDGGFAYSAGPRPILLVRDDIPFGLDDLLSREGYLIIKAPATAMDGLRVLSPSPDLLVAALAASCMEHFGHLPGDWDHIVERYTNG